MSGYSLIAKKEEEVGIDRLYLIMLSSAMHSLLDTIICYEIFMRVDSAHSVQYHKRQATLAPWKNTYTHTLSLS